MNTNIKQKVLENKMLKYILDQIDNTTEKEKTLRAINEMLDQIQEKTVSVIVAQKNDQDSQKNPNTKKDSKK